MARNSPVKSEAPKLLEMGKVILKMGIFERLPKPEFEAFVKDKIEWVGDFTGCVQFKSILGGEKVH